MNTKNAFHACDDCQNPGECAMVAATKQGMPCLPAVNAGQPLDIDQPLVGRGESKFEEISRKLNEHNQARAAALEPTDQLLAFEPVRVELAKMSLLPGDTLVAKIPTRYMEAATITRITEGFKRVVPAGVAVIVVDETMELAILEKANAS